MSLNILLPSKKTFLIVPWNENLKKGTTKITIRTELDSSLKLLSIEITYKKRSSHLLLFVNSFFLNF